MVCSWLRKTWTSRPNWTIASKWVILSTRIFPDRTVSPTELSHRSMTVYFWAVPCLTICLDSLSMLPIKAGTLDWHYKVLEVRNLKSVQQWLKGFETTGSISLLFLMAIIGVRKIRMSRMRQPNIRAWLAPIGMLISVCLIIGFTTVGTFV